MTNETLTYSACYYSRGKSSMKQLRLRMAKYAHIHGINVTVRKFSCFRNTVRKWLRHYEALKAKELKESQMNFEDATRNTTNHPNM